MSAAVELINKLPQAFVSGSDCTIQFNVSTPMYAVIKDNACTVATGTAEGADLGLTMEDDDFVALMKGELNGMTAFMTGKLQLDGNLMLAQQLSTFFDASKVG